MSKLDQILYESLTPSHQPSDDLNRRIIRRRSDMNQSTMIRKRLATAAALGCVMIAGGTTVYAVSHYLRPSQIASEATGDHALAEAFESKTAIHINKSETAGNYIVTLLGIVKGQELKQCSTSQDIASLHKDRSYAALAISRKDKRPMTDEGKTVSPLISGINWQDTNLAKMDATLYHFCKDGVVYELLECDNLEIFAKRGVQLGVVDQFGDEARAFTMDASGTYHRAKEYASTNALFTLPLDPSKGDEAAVTAYLNKIRDQKTADTTKGEGALDADVESFQKKISDLSSTDAAAYIQKHCPKANTSTLSYDDKGDFTWDNGNGTSSGSMNIAGYKKDVPSYCQMDTDGTPKGTRITVITVHDDHTVTMEVYTLP